MPDELTSALPLPIRARVRQGVRPGSRDRRGDPTELRRAEALELPRLTRRSVTLAAILVIVALPSGAQEASGATSAHSASTDPNAPVPVTTQDKPPAGYRLT